MENCKDCAKLERIYGFALEENNYYMTMVPEVKQCCPVKVYVTSLKSGNVYFTVNDKEYSKSRIDFYKSSWRLYDSF